MSDCGACGPVGSRFEQLRGVANMVVEGHRILANGYRDLAKEMTLKDEIEALQALTKYHEDTATRTEENIPTFVPAETADEQTLPNARREGRAQWPLNRSHRA